MRSLLPPNEEERLRELAEYDILDTAPERAFDEIARQAARLCDAPIALLTLVDRDRQWFKARVGFNAAETPRDVSFCSHALLSPELTQVPDLARDPRFRDNPFVTDAPRARFYAGAPLTTPRGHALGTLCVIDHAPRHLGGAQRDGLEALSRLAVELLDLRRSLAESRRREAEQARSLEALRQALRGIQALTDNVPVLIARVDTNRRYVFANRAYQDFLSLPPAQVLGHAMPEVLGERAYETVRPLVDRVLAGEAVTYEAVLPFRTVGPRFIQGSYVPEFGDAGRVAGFVLSAMDITERKAAEARLAQALDRQSRIAETLQHSMLLTTPRDRFPGLVVQTLYDAALRETRVGGDFYDAFSCGPGKVALVVGDASGKGLMAAARTTEVKYALRAFLHASATPDEALAALNDFLCETHRQDADGGDGFIVLALAVIDEATGELQLASAGAEPAVILRRDGSTEEAHAGGRVLGVGPGAAYRLFTNHLALGDTLLLATDGITEARHGRQFLGVEGLAALARAAGPKTSVPQLGQAILEGASRFAGGSLHDDVCLLLARRSSRRGDGRVPDAGRNGVAEAS